jgi:hypothetical protein
MSDNRIDWNALGQAINTSFGTPSTEKEDSYSSPMERRINDWSISGKAVSSKFAASSVTGKLIDDTHLQLIYSAIVNFGSENERRQMIKKWEAEAQEAIKAKTKSVKEIYKEFSDGETIGMKQVSTTDSLELLTGSLHNPKQTCYYRFVVLFELS